MVSEPLSAREKCMKERIAIIGSGIAGMACAYTLHDNYDVSVFEQNDYIGGHTNTFVVRENKQMLPIDTGFIVFNFKNYPNLMRLFQKLEVPLKKTSMSFSVWHETDDIQYCGSSLSLLFAQRKNIFSAKFIRFLFQINRFNSECMEVLENSSLQYISVSDYLRLRKYDRQLLQWYIIPMTSALWSTPPEVSEQFPILSLVRFFHNHGMLGLNSQYQWYTVDGGSEEYKQKITGAFKDRIYTNSQVNGIELSDNGVRLFFAQGTSLTFDKVIIATHADQADKIISATRLDTENLLKNYSYQLNKTVLHTDSTIMPPLRKVWSSWNYKVKKYGNSLHASTTYWMNSLQQVSDKEQYFITLNDSGAISPEKIIKQFDYHHPVFTTDALRVQEKLHTLNANGRVYFCGSYFGNGFHEDAFVSGMQVCEIITGNKYVI